MAFFKRSLSFEFQGGFHFSPLPYVVFFGQPMLFHSQIIERITLLVTYEDRETVFRLQIMKQIPRVIN